MAIRFLQALIMLLTLPAQAATMIEVKTPQGLTRVHAQGSQARMSLDDRRYLVVDSDAQTLLIVDPDQQRVMDMSDTLKSAPQAAADSPHITFRKQGMGPRIAGYPTTRYQYVVADIDCGTLLASEQALQDSGLQQAFKLLQRMAARADAMMPQDRSGPGVCVRAGNRFSAHVELIGIPMRITLKDGKLLSEIVRIEKDAHLPPNAFSVPSGYRTQNIGGAASAAQQLMREAGRLPPEVLQRFRQMQKP